MRSRKGFTLIELLVVIAIIGLLATIVMVSVNSAREKARVAKVKAELRQYYLALEMYYDSNGVFPCYNEGSVSACLNPALTAYGNFSTQDPWGTDYQWHNPGCCIDECTMVLSGGPDKAVQVNSEHVLGQTNNCATPVSDDLGTYFGRVRDH